MAVVHPLFLFFLLLFYVPNISGKLQPKVYHPQLDDERVQAFHP